MNKLDVLQFINRAKETAAKKLDLSNKGITELPDEIGDLVHLESLDLSYNNIEQLPSSICNLKNLRDLLLLRNKIQKLPALIGSLANLKMLDISYNPLVNIPQHIGQAKNLEIFDAGYCKISHLPVEITQLYSLKQLSLEENPMIFPPEKVVKRGLYATMHYLTIEKRKDEASRVMMQVFNMPEKVQPSFRRYIEYFNHMISKANSKDVVFDIKFLNQDFYQEMDLDAGVDNYLYDIISFLKEKIEKITTEDQSIDIRHSYFENKMDGVKEKLHHLSNSLDQKILDIKGIKHEIKGLYNFLDEKRD